MKSIQNFIKKLTKKQLLVLGSVMPLGFIFAIALRIGLTIKDGELDKYKINTFSIVDSLKKDTIFVKRGELYTDTLIDYYQISKKDIKFETFHYDIRPAGFLSIHDKGILRYKLLENGILSEEIIKKNNENKMYSLVENIIGKDFKLDKFELIRYWTTNNFLNNFFNTNSVYPKDTASNIIYTRETEEGKSMLDYEKENIKKVLGKIKTRKKANGTWKD